MIAKEIHALLVEGTDHWGVQVDLGMTRKVFSPCSIASDEKLRWC